MPKITFPFTHIGKTQLGNIYRPHAKVEISSPEINEWLPLEAVIDTGADYTLLPRRYSSLLGLDLMNIGTPETTLGVGGSETIYLVKKSVSLKIGNWEREIPVGFLERDDVPSLLGRLQCLEIIELLLKDHKSHLVLK